MVLVCELSTLHRNLALVLVSLGYGTELCFSREAFKWLGGFY